MLDPESEVRYGHINLIKLLAGFIISTHFY